MQSTFNQILHKMSRDLPGFVAAAVVVVEDGLTVAELSLRPEVEALAAAAYLASVVKSNRKAVKLLSGSPVTSEILIMNDEYSFIIKPIEGMPYFLFVMTVKDEWLGRTMLIVNRYEKQVEEVGLALSEEV